MNNQQIAAALATQRAYFESGETYPVSHRIAALKALRAAILRREDEIAAALRKDLGKSPTESYMCEIGMTLAEITYMLKHIKRFAKPRRVRTPLAQFPSSSTVTPVPFGNVLIMSPWNYPFLLTMDPLVNAIAAGNTAIVKPSAYSPATSAVIEALIAECFPRGHVATVTGGRKENTALLEQHFDFVFFTGSSTVGREVLRHTAEHLTPAVLELGGKSPCIVDDTANIKLAAKRIVFGKYLNCGQTCVAPDFVLCDARIKDALVAAICTEIEAQYGKDPLQNDAYGRIVNEKHFARLLSLIDKEKVVHGGENDPTTCRIAPTVMTDVTFEDAVMGEEIFGPILPVLTFEHFADVFPTLCARQKPLALYLFSEDRARMRAVRERIPFGGGCINDTIIHLATSEMGFGGVGESGMGAYHGKVGFDTFSHHKSVVKKSTRIDLPMRYAPYKKSSEKLLRFFLK